MIVIISISMIVIFILTMIEGGSEEWGCCAVLLLWLCVGPGAVVACLFACLLVVVLGLIIARSRQPTASPASTHRHAPPP